jgi:hypothetical protein
VSEIRITRCDCKHGESYGRVPAPSLGLRRLRVEKGWGVCGVLQGQKSEDLSHY